MQDVETIHQSILVCAKDVLMLPRAFTVLYSHMRDHYVIDPREGQGPIKGCFALSLCWKDDAEVLSLMVAEARRGRGWGKRLVEECLSEALTLGFYKVFSVTYQVDFFHSLGFEEVDKNELPQKVWSDCIHCAKLPNCDQTAM
ncbi:N-acetyltransferase, partial [Oceanidesulfovibrio indonesiensis]|uniref:N-acetyltransferase n=1 Tax=Oceanidesulfovibrio indonesiensis TaxID=54767 RepID=UPI0027BADC15